MTALVFELQVSSLETWKLPVVVAYAFAEEAVSSETVLVFALVVVGDGCCPEDQAVTLDIGASMSRIQLLGVSQMV